MNQAPPAPALAATDQRGARLARLASDPTLFVQKLDPVRSHALLVRMSREDFVAASFLDDRILDPSRKPGWLPNAELAAAAVLVSPLRPLHLILHAGHVGSTLLSRLCEELGGVLSLREPLVLRNLAELHDQSHAVDALVGPEECAALLDTHVALCRRGFADTQAVIVKATSAAARVAPQILARVASARAVYLNLDAETYLAALLAGENSPLDLRGHGAERMRRLAKHLPVQLAPLHSLSIGELAALTWLVERLTQVGLVEEFGARVLSLDFEAMLKDIPATLHRVATHFHLGGDTTRIDRAARSPLLRQYSKATEQSYSAEHRAALLAASWRDNAAEIARGREWLEQRARESPAVGAVLS
jgi:hypothetical protein